MKRYDFSKKDLTIVQGDFGTDQVISRTAVAPGSSMNIDYALDLRADPFTSHVTLPCYVMVDWFYVPNRLIWDEWMEFIGTDDDASTTFPVETTNWDKVLDFDATLCPTGKHSCLPRRAFKLCHNEKYSNEEMGTRYSDIAADDDVTSYSLPAVSQAEARMVLDASVDSPTYDATTNPIDLLEFKTEMDRAVAGRNYQLSGDRYVDALKAMGVTLDWRLQMAPEHLGRTKGMYSPRLQNATDGANLGAGASRYEFTIKGSVKRKRFAEHGYVLGILSVRPLWAMATGGHPPDGLMQTINDFWRGPDFASEWQAVSELAFSTASDNDVYLPPYWQYRLGRNICQDYTNEYGIPGYPSTAEGAWAPDIDYSSLQLGELDSDYNVTVNVRVDGETPVPPDVIR